MLLPSRNPFKCHEEVLHLQPMIPHLNVLIFFPLTRGCSDGLDAFIFFFKKRSPNVIIVYSSIYKTEGFGVRM